MVLLEQHEDWLDGKRYMVWGPLQSLDDQGEESVDDNPAVLEPGSVTYEPLQHSTVAT